MSDRPFEYDLLGTTLAGKYLLREIQGAGFYSVVFTADQYFCGRPVRTVAVKISRQTGLDETTAPELLGDALVLAKLLADSDHEGRRHLVQIFDMGLLPEHDGRAFLVMEHIDGVPLMQHMRAAGRFDVPAGLRMMAQICRAMELVHEQGAVHRDLIPENILVDRKGDIRVVDFGLAAYADPRRGFVPGTSGTFAYMAPETLLGKSVPASDVYSIGLVMYQLFTGGGPHLDAAWVIDRERDRGPENYAIKVGLKFPPPSRSSNQIRNDFQWLDDFLARCLDPDPEARFPDAAALLAALTDAFDDEPEDLDEIDLEEDDDDDDDDDDEPEPWASPEWTPESDREDEDDDGPPEPEPPPAPEPPTADPEWEERFKSARRLLAARKYDELIDLLDVYRPAEWAVLVPTTARTMRLLGQAYLGKGDMYQARECLEQVRGALRQGGVMSRSDRAGVLGDLVRVYTALGMAELAEGCRAEARGME